MDDDILGVLKILIIGESSVGKSSLLNRFVDDVFNPDSTITIGVDYKTKIETINGNKVKLAIWDTAGSERFRSITPNFYRGAHGTIFVYDVTREDSFSKLNAWLEEFDLHSTEPNVVKMLVGNKIDKQGRQVSKERGLAWARKHRTLYIETSAKTKEGVRDAFEELVEKILQTSDLWEKKQQNAKKLRLEEDANEEQPGCCYGWI